jgi:hypothetical protein
MKSVSSNKTAAREYMADGRPMPESPRPSLRMMFFGVTRQMTVPSGFTLSISGTFGILLERHPNPGAVAIWLFVSCAVIGAAIVAGSSRGHQSSAAGLSAQGSRLFNPAPIVVVPLASVVHWWVHVVLLAYSLAGFAIGIAYPVAVAMLFQATRPQPGGE